MNAKKLLVLASLLLTIAVEVMAQANFAVLPVMVEGDVSEEAAKVIFRKTEQIMTRNSAGAAGAADVFAVQAKLNVTDRSVSSGLVREISSVSGELTLTALNKVDNAKYYSVTVPLEAVSKGDGADAALALANTIKPTDAVYTRFVRLAREKIDEYYSDHCSEIIGRAQNLGLSGQYASALVYLTAMPASAPCHEEALELIAALKAKIDAEVEKAEAKEDKRRAEREQRRKEREDENRDKSFDDSDADDSPHSDGGSCENIYIENPNWKFEVKEAVYLPSSRKIRISTLVTYVGKKSLNGDCPLGFRKALDREGDAYDTCYVDGSSWRTFPDDVPVKIEFYIDNVKTNPGTLSFVGLSVDYQKIEIRNLPILE